MKSQNTRENRKKLIQLIHVAKHKLNIDEYAYRQLLKNITGKSSSKDMAVWELEQVIAVLRKKGFASPKKSYKRTSRVNKNDYVKYAKNDQLPVKSNMAYKIRATWINMFKDGLIKDGSDAGLNAFIRHQMRNTHKAHNDKILAFTYEQLNDMQADLMLKRLYAWRKRLLQEREDVFK